MKTSPYKIRISNYLFPAPVILFLLFIITSCSKDPVREATKNNPVDPPPPSMTYTDGIFVINEGNFNWGNSSVTFISEKDSGIIEKNLFERVNNRSLGDVAQSMKIFNGMGFIVVNNSNKVEVVSLSDFTSLHSITGFNSPRYLEIIDSSKAYVTNLFRDISVVDLKNFTILKTIPIPYWTEGLIRYKNLVFVTCVGGFNEPNTARSPKLLVIDSKEDRIIDSINTGKEPLCIVIDRKEKVWVLCTGGYDNVEVPSLMRIDPVTFTLEKAFVFPAGSGTPSRLCINSHGDTLYFLKNGIYQMPVASAELPAEPLIAGSGHSFYGLAVHPTTGNIFVTDAMDFIQDGYVFQYDQTNRTLLNTYKAERIPGAFCFTDIPVRR